MKTLIASILLLAGLAQATISPATVPHVIDSAATPKVSYVDDNDDALKDKLNEAIDTINVYLGGGLAGSVLSSTGDQRLTIDSDNNGTGHRWFVTNNGTSDTLIRILESKAWKFYGDGTAGKLSLSDSLLAGVVSGSNLSLSGTLGVTGASTLAALSATTGAFSSNATIGGTLGVTGASTLAALSATTGTFSSTLGVTGAATLSSTASVSSTLTLGAGIVMNNGQNIVIKNASSTNRNVLTIDASNNTELGGTADGGIEFFVNAGNNGGTVSSAGAWALPSTLAVTGKMGSADSVYAEDGIRVGSAGATDVNWNRASANRWTTPDSVTVAGRLDVTGATVLGSTLSVSSTSGFNGAVTITSGGMSSVGKVTSTDTLGASLGLRVGSAGATDVNWNRASADRWTTPDSVTVAGRLDVTSRIVGSDTVAASLGFRAGSAGATDVSLYRSGSNMWTTPDSVTVSGKIVSSDTIVAASGLRTGGGEAFVYGDTSFTLSVSGCTSTPTPTAYATRVGKVVTLAIESFSCTSNSTSFSMSSIPTGWRPRDGFVSMSTYGTDNGAAVTNVIGQHFGTPGAISFYKDNYAAWTNSGTKSIGFCMACYFTMSYLIP